MSIGDEAYDGWARIFWSVFERSTNPIWLLDFHRVYLEVNPAYCQLLGVSRGDLVGQPIDLRMVPADRAKLAADWSGLWKTGDWVSERTLIRADGSLIHVRLAVRTAEVGEQTIAVAVCTRADTEELSCPPERPGELTSRECEIVSLVALGYTSPEIADQLVISTDTVRTHIRNAMAKTGSKTRAQLVAIALADRHITDV